MEQNAVVDVKDAVLIPLDVWNELVDLAEEADWAAADAAGDYYAATLIEKITAIGKRSCEKLSSSP